MKTAGLRSNFEKRETEAEKIKRRTEVTGRVHSLPIPLPFLVLRQGFFA